MKICSQCGSENDDSLNFCTGCGVALEVSKSEPEFQPQNQQQPEYQQQQQTQYQQPGYQPLLAPPPGSKGKATAALVLGIIGVVTWYISIFNIVSLIISIVGIVLAVKARNEIQVGYEGRGLATAGLVLSIIGTVLSGIGVLAITMCISCLACGAPYY